MTHGRGCLLCGSDLVYREDAVEMTCGVCGARLSGNACCDLGHFVCDACHSASGVEVVEAVCRSTDATDPTGLATEIMQSPAISMHGPEHHFLVSAVLLATFDNALGQGDRRPAHLAEAKRRAERVPGGFCGTHGNCGAGVGTGIFWSIVTGATPISEASWSQSNQLTARSLLRIAEHGGPRCCKRDTWHALIQAMIDVGRRVPETHWGEPAVLPTCTHSHRNKQCREQACVFYRSPRVLPTGEQRRLGSQSG